MLLKFALKSLYQYGPKESLIFLMLVAQLCTGKDILYDNVVLLRGVVSTYLGSATEEKSKAKGVFCAVNVTVFEGLNFRGLGNLRQIHGFIVCDV